ncbi:1-phosphofructokinase [Spirilliplanes yamanashiensis]|uniref:1-phosphofructokinase n=2 Tax=Spirilliplanes yamanashiensis TaxID=42233 RepID=A0A8J4DMG0_9ACTN|nr:1-phosphofructokinase [Spirilliplanes yamanashiensis]
MVFSPAPQLTVTIEQQGGRPELHVHPGGQGVWQARMIRSLGVEVTFCCAAGGEVGTVLEPLLIAEGVTLRLVRRDSGTGWYVHDRRDGSRQEIAEQPGTALTRHDLDELYGLALADGLRAGTAVLGGVADPDLVAPEAYRRLAADLRANGCRVVADLAGEHLEAVLDAGLDVVKVSHEELIEAGRAKDDSTDALVAALRALRADGAGDALVSRAGAGALALIGDEILEVRMPKLSPADPRGAGDSMTAGVAAVLAQGGSLHDAVRTGAAAGALNVTRHGLGTGHVDAITVLAERVELRSVATIKERS